MATRKRILLVDDEPLTLRMLTDILQASGFEILTAHDGAEGLARARAERPDLLILDVMMPKLDGFKVARLLKSDRNYRRIPIIMLTARAGEADSKLSQQAGADFHLVKPIDPATLVSQAKRLIEAAASGETEERR